jgi:hypothetical protein
MSRSFRVWSVCLATAITLAAVGTVTLVAVAAAKPIATAPLKTPMPKAESIPLPTNTFADPLPFGPSLPVVIAVLAVAALMIGTYLMISRRPGSAGRVRDRQFTGGKGVNATSAQGPAGRAV